MAGFLGIDHPLILVHDLAEAARRYAALGFAITPASKHPWGTSTTAAMFDGCGLEIMSIYDEGLLDEKPAGDFRFGRFVRDDLNRREGISLLALNSNDAEADAAAVQARGITCQGTIEFGRNVVLPNGQADRTATTLKVFASDTLPRLSNFAVHQHRPELIYVPQWIAHPNGAFGINQVTILADVIDQPRVRARLEGLYGAEALYETAAGFGARTGNGTFLVLNREAASQRYGLLPPEIQAETQPCYIAVDVTVQHTSKVLQFISRSDIAHRAIPGGVLLTNAQYFGNVFLTFVGPS